MAREDLRQIAHHIADAAGPVIAREVVGRIRSRCQLIAETPGEIGTARPEIMVGIRSFPIPPHVLLFRYSGSVVQVARVLHERQDIERSFSG